jgi:hypothetical protein
MEKPSTPGGCCLTENGANTGTITRAVTFGGLISLLFQIFPFLQSSSFAQRQRVSSGI